ncbi:MAG: lysozyme, partial [Pseudomonadota bacterium]
MTQFRTSKKGVDLIKLFEGFRDRPERLESGDWLIGYGQVRSGAEPSRINRSEATNQLRWEDLPKTEAMVASLVMVPLNQNEFDALVSFAFNLGEDRFKASDVLKLLNAGQKLQAASALDQWTQATLHGEVQTADALIRRRAAEKALFLMPDGQPGAVTS